jgi:hypothetical protein
MGLDVEASVDLDVLGVEADFDIGLKLGTVADKLDGIRQQLRQLAYMPIASSLTASGPADATGKALLKLGRPAHGRLWNITRVSVLGADDQTVLVGSKVAVYVGSSVSPNLSDVLDPAIAADTVPFIIYWNKDQVFVTDNDDLFVIVYGAGANQSLVVNATVLDYNKAGRWEGV